MYETERIHGCFDSTVKRRDIGRLVGAHLDAKKFEVVRQYSRYAPVSCLPVDDQKTGLLQAIFPQSRPILERCTMRGSGLPISVRNVTVKVRLIGH